MYDSSGDDDIAPPVRKNDRRKRQCFSGSEELVLVLGCWQLGGRRHSADESPGSRWRGRGWVVEFVAKKTPVPFRAVSSANFIFVARVPFGNCGTLPGVVVPEDGNVASFEATVNGRAGYGEDFPR